MITGYPQVEIRYGTAKKPDREGEALADGNIGRTRLGGSLALPWKGSRRVIRMVKLRVFTERGEMVDARSFTTQLLG
uniref:Uncharacterized protein n=1 Tax=Candidatus Kentrum sp. DK TaxID=2126562 RepID=A0A450SAB5_9GAMM|nr:MAG: hypothetical protein BECKDK2373B_GA0170837_102232 [Candidatus Kentron sp. DK]